MFNALAFIAQLNRRRDIHAAVAPVVAGMGEKKQISPLRTYVQPPPVSPRFIDGPGDGQADNVPAMVDGVEPARLSSGEYVVPADVVSALGQGNTDSGVRKLDQFLDNVRSEAYGTTQQIRPINRGIGEMFAFQGS